MEWLILIGYILYHDIKDERSHRRFMSRARRREAEMVRIMLSEKQES